MEEMAEIAAKVGTDESKLLAKNLSEEVCEDIIKKLDTGENVMNFMQEMTKNAEGKSIEFAEQQKNLEGLCNSEVKDASSAEYEDLLKGDAKASLKDSTAAFESDPKCSKTLEDLADGLENGGVKNTNRILEGLDVMVKDGTEFIKTNAAKMLKKMKSTNPKLIMMGLTVGGIAVWMACTGTTPVDIIKAFTDPVSDVAKRLIGAIEGTAKAVISPIAGAAGKVFIIIGVVIAIVVLIYGISKAVAASKQKTS
jgi:hypothetical protein